MIRIGGNYLRDIAKVVWESFKLKFSDEITRIVVQDNSIINFYYVVHRFLIARNANIRLYLR